MDRVICLNVEIRMESQKQTTKTGKHYLPVKSRDTGFREKPNYCDIS
jgi:hypothetical protein